MTLTALKLTAAARVTVAMLAGGLVIAGALVPTAAAHAAGSRLVAGQMTSAAIGGPIDYTVYLPDGYDEAGTQRYPSIYLFHGRGDTQTAWQQEAGDLDQLIADGSIPPMIVIMPDAPWSNRGSYYVDSLYTGDDPATTPGVAVETAFTTDLVSHIDATYHTINDRAARAVGGYSMGGAGALRYVTAHQDIFSAAIVLSPAVYVPTTPVGGSSTQDFGAYGVGDKLFDPARYDALNYPAGFAALDPSEPIHLFIAVGDDEYVEPNPVDHIHDLDYEAATLYNAAKRVPGVTAEFREYNGGHDWSVWKPGFREGIVDLAGYLQSTPPTPLSGSLAGTAGDDSAGGVLARADGTIIQAVNAAGDLWGDTNQGGLDGVVEKLDAAGNRVWTHAIATAAADRLYGVVDAGGGGVIAAGYTHGNLDGAHPAGNDDAIVVKLDADGKQVWATQFGSATAADRVYGVAADGAGGAYLTGYSSGSLAGDPSAGDKDAFLARVDASGALLWSHQLGGTGEDKGLAVALAADGGAYVGGIAGAAMPGASSKGGSDGWVARFAADGTRSWLTELGTTETDQVSGLVATADGVAATGYTGGTLGKSSLGDNDAFVTQLAGADGSATWTTQDGSSGDDRGAAIAAGDDGLLVVGHTGGRVGSSSGGVDVFTLTVSSSGAVTARTQFGTSARDGADDFDEANLFVDPDGAGKAWIQGLTEGSLAGSANAGLGDVFLTSMPWAATASSTSGAAPTTPWTGILGLTGVDVTRVALAGLALLLGGVGVVIARLRRNPFRRRLLGQRMPISSR